MDNTRILRRVLLELKLKRKKKRDQCEDPEQEGSARYWKTSREEEKALLEVEKEGPWQDGREGILSVHWSI
jgi:hypothetical protein